MEIKPPILVIHLALAPYRVDFFNEISRRLPSLLVLFQINQMIEHPYAQNDFHLSFTPRWVISRKLRRKAPIYLALKTLPVLAGIFMSKRPQMIFSYEFGPLPLLMSLLCRLLGLPHLAWTDDALCHAETCGLFRRFRRALVLRWSAGLLVCNTATRDFFAATFKKPIAVCGILQQEDLFRTELRAAENAALALARTHALGDKKVFLCVGRLSPEKNLEWAIRAFATCPDTRAVLVFCGSGDEEGRLRDLARHAGIASRVIFTGYLDRRSLFPWYHLGSLLLFPSMDERYGAVVNEALLSGLPVLCSQWAGAAELIRPGWNGDIIDPGGESSGEIFRRWAARVPTVPKEIRMRSSLMEKRFEDSVREFCGLVAQCGSGDAEARPLRPS
jgi:glycosyltransferase involved in cell wall biosynthesis